MKFTINIDQRRAIEMGDIDLIDCVILDWLRNFCTSKNPKIQNNRVEGMAWVSYSEFIRDMPLLRYKDSTTVGKRLKALAGKNYIKMKTIGQRTYVDTTQKAEYLWADDDLNPVDKPMNEIIAPMNQIIGTDESNHPTITTSTKYTKPRKIQNKPVDKSHGHNDARGVHSPAKEKLRKIIETKSMGEQLTLTGG